MNQPYFAPAKINLFLAITGRRADGFHDLVSVVAPLTFGDSVVVVPAAEGEFRLTCSDPALPCDDSNLAVKAAQAFVARTGWRGGAALRIEKRVPIGAGLGGGSSDAAATLRGLNVLAGNPADPATLSSIAAAVGSDCALFLHGGPVVMRGRGERIEALPAGVGARIRGRRVLLFKPAFGIATASAYRRMAEMAAQAGYIPPAEAERRIADWLAAPGAPLEDLLFNHLELPAFEKYLALPALLDALRHEFGLQPRMSGSGSACFALLPDEFDAGQVVERIRASWGDTAFVADTRLA